MARKDVLDRLSVQHDVHVRGFLDAADGLESVAAALSEVALASDQEATYHALRAGTARSQASKAAGRAQKIRELIG